MFAAKSFWDGEIAPGRTWLVSGMGANVRTIEMATPGGGRGKTMKMYMTPIVTFAMARARILAFQPPAVQLQSGMDKPV